MEHFGQVDQLDQAENFDFFAILIKLHRFTDEAPTRQTTTIACQHHYVNIVYAEGTNLFDNEAVLN